MVTNHRFSLGEEIANAVSHGVGMLLSVSALVILIVFSSLNGTWVHVVSMTIYGATMVFLYTSSTLLHSLPNGKAKDIFEVLDHSSIYFFIAGCYTPFMLIAVRGKLGMTIFISIWVIAILGTIFKIFFVQRFVIVSTLIYILMGWLIVFAWSDLVANVPETGVLLLVIGGLLYTIGALFYMWRWFKYHHMVWHLFVLAATIVHFFSVLLYILPIDIS